MQPSSVTDNSKGTPESVFSDRADAGESLVWNTFVLVKVYQKGRSTHRTEDPIYALLRSKTKSILSHEPASYGMC